MKYCLLIVDDECGERKPTYENLLSSRFGLRYVSTEEEFLQEDLYSPHAIIVDVNLSSNYWGMSLKEVLDKTMNKPVILVSSRWADGKGQLERVLKYSRDYNIVHSIFLNETANSDYIDATQITISFALDKFYGRSQVSVSADQEIGILHLSDLQFGDKQTESAFLVENDIVKLVSSEKKRIDFVAITGDITYSGHPDEFAEAEAWITRLTKSLWQEKHVLRDRLLLVPGNHDVDIRLHAADVFKYQFCSKEFVKADDERRQSHALYGLAPYRKFAYSLSRDPRYLTSESLCWTNDSFLHIGLRFHQINSAAYINSDSPDASGVPEEFLGSVTEIDEGVFPIVLSHHGPASASNVSGKSFDNWDRVKQFLKHSQAKLMLHGHGHARLAGRLDDWEETRATRLVRVMAPSTHLAHDKLAPGERRGLNIISLMRANEAIKRVEVTPYEYREARLRKVLDDPYSFDY